MEKIERNMRKIKKEIKGLNQEEILTGSVDALNGLLVSKGILTAAELQNRFLDWVKAYKSNKKT
ncbi:MAG: hypothetical protein Q7S12_04105 [bacterium]|nr:hypothetical protein [bacterium]